MTTARKISSICLDEISRKRLQCIADEMSLSRSSVVRILIAQAWKDRSDSTDPLEMLLTAAKDK